MRLVPGKLYRVMETHRYVFGPFRLFEPLMLFLEKGKHVPGTTWAYAYTPYYFLFGETKIELRKYYNVKLNEILEKAEEEL